MRVPRDLSGDEQAKLLEKLGYRITRQTGSHMRLTTTLGTEHHITIPRHPHLKIGTLEAILKELSEHMKVSKDDLIENLWGG